MYFRSYLIKTFRNVFCSVWFVFVSFNQAYAEMYQINDFEIRVVDALSGEALEGVLMLAYWSILPGAAFDKLTAGVNTGDLSMEEYENIYRQLEILETKEIFSDAEGWIRYKGWKVAIPHDRVLAHPGEDPIFILFKDGYFDAEFRNYVNHGLDYDGGWIYLKKLRSHIAGEEKPYQHAVPNANFWREETIKLYKVDQKHFKFSDNPPIDRVINWIAFEKDYDCPWVNMPHSMIEHVKRWKLVTYSTLEQRIEKAMQKTSCMSFEHFKEKYL